MLDFFKIGNMESNTKSTGVTVILAEEGAVGGVSVRGSAPATRETDLLKSENSVDKVNAVFLSGGSAFGLDAASGIMQHLTEKNVGYPTSAMPVPIVCGACLYDLEYKDAGFPDKKLGYEACLNAKVDNFECGNVGAGCGATVGKVLGAASASKGGLGVAKFAFDDGVEMCAIVAVNAFGDIFDFKTGKKVSGATFNGKNIDIVDCLKYDRKMLESLGKNTTIGCIITNAKLTKNQANKLADIAHDGYAMTIRPTHTMVDGDAIFAMASGEVEGDFMKISCYAPILMAQAVLNAFEKMIYAVDSAVMRASDKMTIEGGVSELELMRMASIALFNEVIKNKPNKVAIVCGSGNNGGDGYSLACELLEKTQISVVVFGKVPKTNSAKFYFDKFLKLNNASFCEISQMKSLEEFDLIVDCLLGVGFDGELRDDYKEYIKIINQSKYILSCDIPSGLNADNGIVNDIAVKANITLAIQSAKVGHFLNDGKDFVGKLEICDIGIKIIGKQYAIVDENYAKSAFPDRKQNTNKGSYGSIGVFACSHNMVGAGVLSATSAVNAIGESAMVAGSGLCKLFVPNDMVSALWGKIVHTAVFGHGELEKHKFDCVAFGMGVGNNYPLFEKVLQLPCNKVVDADGLNMLAENIEQIKKLKGSVLTPHPKEFSRLTKISVAEILQNPIEIAEQFAKENKIILLLKGATTIVTDGDKTMLNIAGSSCLAKGGSGDVLTGIIASLIGRKIAPFDAAIIASFVAGKCAEKLEAEKSQYTVLAMDVAQSVGKVIEKILN